ncbi:MAG: pyrroline-5-carboxylate reductase [Gammaproteobacteria bacterium]|nr:pyrroline-5-carboxylate reductase [Gammaproteobacteria bacterium]MDE2304854.1 pyrroline-5-carboxylate reductase [Gammaproteobacteria bacterium]
MQDPGRILFIGGGNMAAALIGGLLRRGISAQSLSVVDPDAARREDLRVQFGLIAHADAGAFAATADVVLLAVKPQQMRSVLVDLAPRIGDPKALVISIAAGIDHASIGRWLTRPQPIVRAMPNRPALQGFGATGLFAPPTVSALDRDRAEAILGAVGLTVWVEHEEQMDVVTALSGSGPAYFFLLMEALESAARDLGLPADAAHRLTVETALGAAQMAHADTASLATLREQVTSKGGTTAAALAEFEAAGFGAIVARALGAARRRSAELAAEFAPT